MMIRKGAVSMAIVAAVTASACSAFAETKAEGKLSLDPTVVSMDAAPAAPRKALMLGFEKLGAASTLDQYGINIYGWVEGSYTYNHRHMDKASSVSLDPNKVGPTGTGPFNHQANDGIMGNQLVVRIERTLAGTDKVDVGGMVEVMYGSDAGAIHSNGLEWGNDNRFSPQWQFDVPQAYLDIAVGVQGLSFRAGKFYTTMGYEVINPDGNPLFSHSYIFYSLPFTQMGILAMYQVNDQIKVTAGITRGWDQAFEDNPSCYPDFLGQVSWAINKQMGLVVNASVGPQNGHDNSHWRVALNPIFTYQATDALSFAAEGLYIYDGNYAASSPPGYGDIWGLALYAKYVVNDYVTVNVRAEKIHNFAGSFATATGVGGSVNIYAFTLGATLTPFPTDALGKNLKIRPELRYDVSEDAIFSYSTGAGSLSEQFTIGCDIFYLF